MNTFLWWVASFLIKAFTANALTADNLTRVKNFIVAKEDEAIDKIIKHQQAADMLKSFVPTLTDDACNVFIKIILWSQRLVAGKLDLTTGPSA